LKGLRKGSKTAAVTVVAMIEAEDQAGYKETDKPLFLPILALSLFLFLSVFMLNPHEKGIDSLSLFQIC